MKNIDWETLLIPVLMIGSLFLVVLLVFGTDAYSQYLDTYNTQKDREMFLKSYEIVVECRKDASVINMDKICGTIPTFVDAVK
ncbi:hypothetical protein EBU71_15995 [bacterium]|nr:hypothetical protein [Candidatus Elulimicrobium humile]